MDKEGCDRLCGLTFLETLDFLVEKGEITSDKGKELAEKYTAIVVCPSSLLDKIKRLLKIEDNNIMLVRFIKI